METGRCRGCLGVETGCRRDRRSRRRRAVRLAIEGDDPDAHAATAGEAKGGVLGTGDLDGQHAACVLAARDLGTHLVHVHVVARYARAVLRGIPGQRHRGWRRRHHADVRGRRERVSIVLARHTAGGSGEGKRGEKNNGCDDERRVLSGGWHSPRVVGSEHPHLDPRLGEHPRPARRVGLTIRSDSLLSVTPIRTYWSSTERQFSGETSAWTTASSASAFARFRRHTYWAPHHHMVRIIGADHRPLLGPGCG